MERECCPLIPLIRQRVVFWYLLCLSTTFCPFSFTHPKVHSLSLFLSLSLRAWDWNCVMAITFFPFFLPSNSGSNWSNSLKDTFENETFQCHPLKTTSDDDISSGGNLPLTHHSLLGFERKMFPERFFVNLRIIIFVARMREGEEMIWNLLQ